MTEVWNQRRAASVPVVVVTIDIVIDDAASLAGPSVLVRGSQMTRIDDYLCSTGTAHDKAKRNA